jgi:anti-anti-sigma regulatory factor
MSATSTAEVHATLEMIDHTLSDVVVIDFLSSEIVGPSQARELGEQLDSLLGAQLPRAFIIDFTNVQSLGSSGFAEIVSFARKVRRLVICNMRHNLRLGAAMTGLDDYAEFAIDRRAAIESARRAAMPCDQDTVDFPVMG